MTTNTNTTSCPHKNQISRLAPFQSRPLFLPETGDADYVFVGVYCPAVARLVRCLIDKQNEHRDHHDGQMYTVLFYYPRSMYINTRLNPISSSAKTLLPRSFEDTRRDP